jgi:hypothetical protein
LRIKEQETRLTLHEHDDDELVSPLIDGWVDGWMYGERDRHLMMMSAAQTTCHQTAGFKNNVLTKRGRYYPCTGTQGLGK